jgi:hypothetical protein
MSPPSKKQLKKGAAGYGYEPGDENFLAPDNADGNWTASASGDGYNAKFDDDSGHVRGANWDDSDSHGLRNKLSDAAQASIRDIGYLIDGQVDQPAGPLLGGGGPLSDNVRDPDDSSWKGSGRKGPRYSNPPPASAQGNMRGWKK